MTGRKKNNLCIWSSPLEFWNLFRRSHQRLFEKATCFLIRPGVWYLISDMEIQPIKCEHSWRGHYNRLPVWSWTTVPNSQNSWNVPIFVQIFQNRLQRTMLADQFKSSLCPNTCQNHTLRVKIQRTKHSDTRSHCELVDYTDKNDSQYWCPVGRESRKQSQSPRIVSQ